MRHNVSQVSGGLVHVLTCMVIAVSIFVGKESAYAGEELSPTKQAKGWPQGIDEVTARAFTELKLQEIAVKFRSAKSWDGFHNHFAFRLKQKDRKAMKQALGRMKEFPTVTHEGRELTFKLGDEVLKVFVEDLANPNIKFNGVVWSYSAHQDLVWQLGLLEKKLKLQKGGSSSASLFDFLLPRAEATPITIGWLVLTAGGAIVGAVAGGVPGMVADALCSGVTSDGRTSRWPCNDWARARIAGRLRGSPYFNAGQNQNAADMENVLANWEVDRSQFQCPRVQDNEPRVGLMRVRQIRFEGEGDKERMVPVAEWVRMRIVLNPAGDPISALVVDDNADPAKVDIRRICGVAQFHQSIAFTSARQMVSLTVPRDRERARRICEESGLQRETVLRHS